MARPAFASAAVLPPLPAGQPTLARRVVLAQVLAAPGCRESELVAALACDDLPADHWSRYLAGLLADGFLEFIPVGEPGRLRVAAAVPVGWCRY